MRDISTPRFAEIFTLCTLPSHVTQALFLDKRFLLLYSEAGRDAYSLDMSTLSVSPVLLPDDFSPGRLWATGASLLCIPPGAEGMLVRDYSHITVCFDDLAIRCTLCNAIPTADFAAGPNRPEDVTYRGATLQLAFSLQHVPEFVTLCRSYSLVAAWELEQDLLFLAIEAGNSACGNEFLRYLICRSRGKTVYPSPLPQLDKSLGFHQEGV